MRIAILIGLRMMIIAIDPGASGAVVVDLNGEVESFTMPVTRRDCFALADKLVRKIFPARPVVYTERITGFVAGAGAGQMFKFGEVVERINCAFEFAGCRMIEVAPQKWQKHIGVGHAVLIKPELNATPQTKQAARAANAKLKRGRKNQYKAEAQRRFPEVKVTLVNADALLLLEYGRWMEQGQRPGTWLD